jgi:hypothetical protein
MLLDVYDIYESYIKAIVVESIPPHAALLLGFLTSKIPVQHPPIRLSANNRLLQSYMGD